MGIEEVELALSIYEPGLYIKESQFPNVILVELSMDPAEAVAILREAPTTVVNKIIPIEIVVRTQMDLILEKVSKIAEEKTKSGDSFVVRGDLRGGYLESKDDLIEKVSNHLVERENLILDENNFDWIVQIEVVGEDTGISILKPNQIVKKLS